jgi:hypothetical protein
MITLAGLRDRLQGRARALIIAAAVVIGLAVTIPMVIWKTQGSTPPITAAPALDILHYGVNPPAGTVSCGPGNNVKFTFTISARGSRHAPLHLAPRQGPLYPACTQRNHHLHRAPANQEHRLHRPLQRQQRATARHGGHDHRTSGLPRASYSDYICHPPHPAP